jgi:transcriptional regulator with XRE-family HTH domain
MPRVSRLRLPSLERYVGRESFGQRLARLRKELGLSQLDLAKKVGLIQVLISNYELDKLRPRMDIIVRLAIALEVSTDELLGLRSRRTPTQRGREEQWLWKKFRKILSLPQRDRRTVIRMINSVVGGRGK